ncbi:MAG: hypothetical protein HZC54_15200 [Verrucomicrobia bacterium]|nr:hypothetical protein [Verrucomicrobiota bacterium]
MSRYTMLDYLQIIFLVSALVCFLVQSYFLFRTRWIGSKEKPSWLLGEVATILAFVIVALHFLAKSLAKPLDPQFKGEAWDNLGAFGVYGCVSLLWLLRMARQHKSKTDKRGFIAGEHSARSD